MQAVEEELVRAPFPFFGGKRRVAHVVWKAFGPDVPNYVEPFAGSLAVLLGRPGGAGKIETVNDVSRFLANFWRAVTAEPEHVAEHCDWPVNEADLHARHVWLCQQLPTLRKRMHEEPDYFDVKIAGWWVWGICLWIGGGWCVETETNAANVKKHPKLDGIGKGVHSERGHRRSRQTENPTEQAKRPDLGGMNKGVHQKDRMVRSKQRPIMKGDSLGQGVHKHQLPKLSVTDGAAGVGGVHASGLHQKIIAGDSRRGVHSDRKPSFWNTHPAYSRRPDLSNAHGVHLPSLGNDRGINGISAAPCTEWFRALQARLRRVRVACGDWKRVVGPSVLGKGRNVGGRRPCAVFLDPPYRQDMRDPGLYAEDIAGISDEVRIWALEHGDDPDLRIALCGYEGEHEMPDWHCYAWKAARGYAAEGNDNRERERIWLSPHCLPIDEPQLELFRGAS